MHATRFVVLLLDNTEDPCFELLLQAQVLPVSVELKNELLAQGCSLLRICWAAIPQHLYRTNATKSAIAPECRMLAPACNLVVATLSVAEEQMLKTT